MSLDKIIALAVGGMILFAPTLLKWLEAGWAKLPAKRSGTSYITAVENLGLVRTRLVQTECLNEPQKAAIDTLTLALVGGSEK